DLVEIDKNLDEGANPDELLPIRADLNRKLYEINQMDLKDVAQKPKSDGLLREKEASFGFRVDFAKANDFVHWDFLLDVLSAFGFGSKWCHWIRGIFGSNMASVLVNGNPTTEFPIYRGLKQGDP
nr:RNA-directed DNA polymerase, eukaryota [Tanacetum cinerariifolium]